MDLMLILKAVLTLSALGLITSAVLSTAARRFYVEVDPRVEAVAAILPGSNCGACGNPSCFAVAEGIVEGTLPVNACVAGGQSCADSIAVLMGAEACAVASAVSVRACGGGNKAERAYEYGGVQSCAAVARLAGGSLVCTAGCLGYGDCVEACPFDAIAMDERGLPVIDLDACTGCGICVHNCPRGGVGLLSLVPENAPVAVRCNAHDKIKDRKAACSACCIACKKCERACPADAIHVIDALAVIDYEKCTACGTCVSVCPQNCIDIHGRAASIPPRAGDGYGKNAPGFAVQDQATE
ncbi:MAG: RnfABCDGE type electron transport complex subunit B [Coriobacteriia bacterium]|nr:RnfABCDGE type electron transport complex subunit B [Coriobacteriia bacterium]